MYKILLTWNEDQIGSIDICVSFANKELRIVTNITMINCIKILMILVKFEI